ncbi:MAG TPA: hypothetical protein VK698_39380 [Kofleriaceae bacterium]|nr:hypothetical protein [Kofleriaceae bacterium]
MPTWILTVTSRTGAKVEPLTGAPSHSFAVYDRDVLEQHLDAAKYDPRDLHIDVRKIA